MVRGFVFLVKERGVERDGRGGLVVLLALLFCVAEWTGRWSKQLRVFSGYPRRKKGKGWLW